MEGVVLGLHSGGGGGGSPGGSTNESTVSKVDVVEKEQYVEGTSYPAENELELGLDLSLGVGGCGGGGGKAKASAWGDCGRILIAKDFPSVISSAHRGPNSCASTGVAIAVSGTKRAADSPLQEGGSPSGGSQVVGWPPIGVHRMNSLVVSQTKALKSEEDDKSSVVGQDHKSIDASKKKICKGNNTNLASENIHLGFVKVNMDGVPIGRKVDLNAHAGYETLARALEDMFFKSNSTQLNATGLLDGLCGFVLTYEDKEGDWMLVGDVPWGMFHSSVKRLRIMRTSEANGLASRFEVGKERSRPV